MAAVGAGVAAAFERLAPTLPVSLPALTDDQLVGLAQSVEDLGRQADALRLTIAREFDNRTDPTLGELSLARKLGEKTAAAALEVVTRTSAEDARRRVKEAANLAKVPVIEDAVAAGTLGRAEAAEVIAPLLAAVGVAEPELVRAACENLVELCAAVPASAVAEAARAWAAVLDPDGIEPVEATAIEKRFLTLGRARNGVVKLAGLLPVEQAAAIRTVLDAYVNPKAGVSFTSEQPTDTRTAGQKRADILHAVFAAQARAGDAPTMGGAHPTILVTVRKDELESRSGACWVDGEVEPISADAASRIACTGGIQIVETSAGGEVLNLGLAQRCFTPAQRRALAARDRGCVIPGCDIPARWCEAHHLDPARNDGPTDVGNAALLCWWHHLIIDDGPYRLRIRDGVPEVRWVFGSHATEWVRAVHDPVLRRTGPG